MTGIWGGGWQEGTGQRGGFLSISISTPLDLELSISLFFLLTFRALRPLSAHYTQIWIDQLAPFTLQPVHPMARPFVNLACPGPTHPPAGGRVRSCPSASAHAHSPPFTHRPCFPPLSQRPPLGHRRSAAQDRPS